jgi:hypothetical protein
MAQKYKLLRPCAVRSKDGESATMFTKYGTELEVPDSDQANTLVEGGYLEKVSGSGDAKASRAKDTGAKTSRAKDTGAKVKSTSQSGAKATDDKSDTKAAAES